jgi:glycosyltransferase involved in cell wall biosynthesis
MSSPHISVVVPAFNAAATLPECLESLLRQTCRDFEVLVVDDGSADGTAGIAEAYARRDGRVRWVARRNEGVSAARNFGAEAARGDVLFFLDADDLLPENGLEERARSLEERPH